MTGKILTHPRRGPAEYTLEVYCDDPSHEEREIDVLGYWPTPPGTVGFLNWLTERDSLQTPFGERMVAEARAGEPVDLGGWSGTPRDMDYGVRWRFECPGCRTVPGHGAKMDAILEILRTHGVPRISLPRLASRLNA